VKTLLLPVLTAAVLAAATLPQSKESTPQGGEKADEIGAAMANARRFTQPGEHHKALERFLGKWSTEMRFFMGGTPTPPEKGTAEFTWLMAGRWLESRSKGSMMGMPAESFLLMGYDNFKQSYVTTMVSSIDTAMNHSEGDMDPIGKALISYGTLDEYLTGEHDKMVKYVWRFPADDKLVLEVHDLPIGEKNTKVVEIAYTRVK
jgi:uncharacterized protein DUF1579